MPKPPDLRSDGPPQRLNSPTVESVRSLEAFQGLADEDIQHVIDAGTFVSVPAGWSLIWEQTPADKAYLLLSGEVSIQHDGQEFARVGAGQLIGETAIVTRHLRNATVVAFTDIEALHLTREAVERLSEESPAFRATLEDSAASHRGGSED
jgi:CRP/FNR family cyclic AMP-dependent transcriptional regulator